MTAAASISTDQRRSRLIHRHRLVPSRRTDDVVTIVDDLVGLHSSDPATVYLSTMTRMANPSPLPLERALYDDRFVLRQHAMRRTLWAFSRAVAELAHNSTARKLAVAENRRLARLIESNRIAVDGLAWIAAAKEDLHAEIEGRGTVLTRDLGVAVPHLAVPLSAGPATLSAHTRVLLVMGFEGSIVRARPTGTWISSQYAWSTMDAWVPDVLAPHPIDEAARKLLERYLRAFGPATMVDIAWWTGWTKTQTAAAVTAVEAQEVALDNGSTGLILPGDETPAEREEPSVALLPGLDSTTMGWKERDWYLDPEHVDSLFDRNGNAGPTVWLNGRIVGGWVQRADGTIACELLTAVDGTERRLVDAEAERVRTMYGDTRHKCRFQTPMTSRLLSET